MKQKRKYQDGGLVGRKDRIQAIKDDPSMWNIQDYIKFGISEPGLESPMINTEDMALLPAGIVGVGLKIAGKGVAKYLGRGATKTLVDKEIASGGVKVSEKMIQEAEAKQLDRIRMIGSTRQIANKPIVKNNLPTSNTLKNSYSNALSGRNSIPTNTPPARFDQETYSNMVNALINPVNKQGYGGYIPHYAFGGGLSGAMAGAGTGAAIGAPFGGIGAPIGAGICFLVGGTAGWLSEDEKLKQQRAQEDQARILQQQQNEFVKSLNQQQVPISTPDTMNYGYKTNFAFGGPLPYEAEGGEVIESEPGTFPQPIGDTGSIKQIAPGAVKVNGPSHSGGGVDLAGGTYVFSDRLTTSDGDTFASAATKLYKEFNEAQKLYSKSNDRFIRTAHTRTIGKIQRKLDDLRGEQEAERGADETLTQMKTGGWIKAAVSGIKKAGTAGICSGSSYGGQNCPPGSKRYNLAKTFRKMARNKEDGGFVDPVKEKEYNMLRSKLVQMALGGGLPKNKDGGFKLKRAEGGPVDPLAYLGMASNLAGPAYDIAQSFRKREQINYPQLTPSKVSYDKSIQEQINELDRQREAAVSAVRNNATSSQEYLQMVRAIDNDVMTKKQRLISTGREQEANVNAQSANQMAGQNAQIRMAEEQARSQALATKQMAGRAGAYGLGEVGSTGIRDVMQYKQQKEGMDPWKNYFSPKQPQYPVNMDMYESLYPNRMLPPQSQQGIPMNVQYQGNPPLPDFDISSSLKSPYGYFDPYTQYPR